MEKSMAQLVAELSPEDRAEFLAEADPDHLVWDWSFWGRPAQFAPPGDWLIWLVLAGRGFGKTRTAAEWVRDEAKTLMPDGSIKRFALVGRIFRDVRDVMLDGESGIMNVTPPEDRPEFQPSKNRLVWPNGNVATLFTADEPNSLRGPQFTHAWGDEIAAWRRLPDDSGLTAWDNLRFATRLGKNPKIVVTTTPKRVPLMYALIKEYEERPGRIVISRGSTMDNLGNLSDVTVESLQDQYSGSSIERQELYGEMLNEIEGALWLQEMIEDNRVFSYPTNAPMRVIGVDPSVAENPRDYCGIVAAASTSEYNLFKRQAWVIEDASIKGSPDTWANRVVEMAHKYNCPVVAEHNQGHALIANAIHQIDPTIKVFPTWSKQGKRLRAEPVVMAYEQGRVHHVENKDAEESLIELENQMTSWIPEESRDSPDRVDALVHALTALLIKPPEGFGGGTIRAKSPASRRITGLSTTTTSPSLRLSGPTLNNSRTPQTRRRPNAGPTFRVR